MNNKLLLTVILFLLLAGCKKNAGSGSSDGANYMKFKLSGTQKNYATVAAVSTKANGYNTMVLTGASPAGDAMVILLTSVTDFSASGTFTAAMINGLPLIQALLSYSDPSKKGFTSSYPNLTPNATAQVTITSISTDEVKGTFTCTLVDETDFTTIKYLVTEGEFSSKLAHQ
jgi:hypothetical protein